MISSFFIYLIRKNTDDHTGVIHTKTEPLPNKQIFMEYFNLKGAVFVYIHLHIIENHRRILNNWCVALL